jgi:thiol-disulfide isomerase/thioredoxin
MSTLSLGSALPRFGPLPDVSGKELSDADFIGAKALVVVFSCNHCPYVQAYEGRMVAFQREYAARGVRLVAINSNETVHYPEDSFDAMIVRAKQQGYNFPYLRDEDQSVAAAFGATHTPEFFLFAPSKGARRFELRYCGRMADNHQKPAAVKQHYLRDAVDAVLEERPVVEPETHSIGCTIKWR